MFAHVNGPDFTTSMETVPVSAAKTMSHTDPVTANVVAAVGPDERTAAAAYTNTARYVVRPPGPLVARPIIAVSLGAPFVIAGALKSFYDLGLYALFRRVKLPDSSA